VIPPGEVEGFAEITVYGDRLDEAGETVVVSFRNARNATVGGYFGLGVGTIVDDDPRPRVAAGFGAAVERDDERAVLRVPVNLSAPSGRQVTVRWQTVPLNATAPADYTAASGIVTFEPGATSAVLRIALTGDDVAEPPELFLVALSDPRRATLGGAYGLGLGVALILDDD
jgi:chitinase